MKSFILGTILVCLGAASASAGCLADYERVIGNSLVDDAMSDKIAPAATTSVLPLPVSTIMDAIDHAHAEKMRNLIREAYNEVGLTLAQYVSETGLSKQNAITLIVAFNSKNVFCMDKENLLTFDDAVKLGKIK